MRIREIILDSICLPFKKYKLFLFIILQSFICEVISELMYSIELGKWTPLVMLTNAMITMIILGFMLNLTYRVVFNEEIELNPKEHFLEGVKEYIVTEYYILLTFITSSIFVVPTGVYARLMHINEYISRMDINTTFMTLHELSHQLPVNLQIDLQHSLQLNVLIAANLFILFSSMGFIGKTLLYNTGKISYALDFRKIFVVIKNIGIKKYLKFIIGIAIVIIIVTNSVLLLGYFFRDNAISAIIEAFTLIFSTNAFYSIYFKDNPSSKHSNEEA